MERKKRRRIILITITIVIASLFSYYVYRIKSADLLTDWKTSGGWITPGFSQYHVINSETGDSTYLPSFLLWMIDQDKAMTFEEKKYINENIILTNPTLSRYSTGPRDRLDENTLVMTSDFGDGYESVVLYDLSTDTYKVAVQTNGIVSVIAGQGKIFILTLPVGVSWETSMLPEGTTPDSNSDEIDIANYNQPIYLYDPDKEEITKIGEYNSIKNLRNLRLEAVLK